MNDMRHYCAKHREEEASCRSRAEARQITIFAPLKIGTNVPWVTTGYHDGLGIPSLIPLVHLGSYRLTDSCVITALQAAPYR